MEEVSTISASSFKAAYDEIGDVMYVNDGHPRAADTKSEDDGFLWRYDRQSHALIGFTIEDFSRYKSMHPDILANRIKMSTTIKMQDLAKIVRRILDISSESA